MSSGRRSRERTSRAERVLQIGLAMVGLIGAVARAFAPVRAKDAAWPVLDATTLAWLGLIVVAYLLPRISEITLGDTSLKLREKADEATSGLEKTIDALADLLQNWANSALIYIHLLADADSDRASLLLMNYLRDRMGEARKWLSDDPSANVRISLWLFNKETDRLEFFFSNEIDDVATLEATFHPGEGLMGQAFLERRRWNEPDARQIPGFKSIRRSGTEGYDAVMCVPVVNDPADSPLGMLNVDKRGDEFSETAESIAVALAAQCAFAFDQYWKAPTP
jgi:GAF domain-containing protein